MKKANRYQKIIETIFLDRHQPDVREIEFEREDIVRVAAKLQIKLPKNLGDLIYTFRYRGELPQAIRDTAPEGETWLIRPAGTARYRFALSKQSIIVPHTMMAETKIPNATPGVIEMYAQTDEQALLAKLRYNRLIDLFTGLACYSLQNHLRTTVPGMGQVETDEVYVGLDRKGGHYVLPVQVKGNRDLLNVVQIEQDMAMCADKFPLLQCRPLAAQFMNDELIALFEFCNSEHGVVVLHERHYRLVAPDQIHDADLKAYQQRPD